MTGSGGRGLAAGDPVRRTTSSPTGRGAGTSETSDDAGALDGVPGGEPAVNAATRAAARQIAARLAVRRPRERRAPTRGAGELASLPFRGGADEIDLDRTLDALTERRPLRAEDVMVRERRRRRRAVVLAVDVSGSMRGERLHTAAATVGALTSEFAREAFSVVAFWSDAAVLLRLGEQAGLEAIVDRMLAIKPVGLTNIAFPLTFAEEELRSAPGHEQRVILLSDCVHNAGPDPGGPAARVPRLDILFDVSGEHDAEVARDLARTGRGRVLPVRDHRDVAPALNDVLGG